MSLFRRRRPPQHTRLAREATGPLELTEAAREAVRREAVERAMYRLSVMDPADTPTPRVLDQYLTEVGVAS